MLTITLESNVGPLVRQNPARSRVFESFQIDYCCGGKLSLLEACQRKSLNPDSVIQRLAECDLQRAEVGDLLDADTLTLSELADHIQNTHHDYLKKELPRLESIVNKVARVHGEENPRLYEVQAAFQDFVDEVMPHMVKEEMVLFPLIRRIESAARAGRTLSPGHHPCGSIANPIAQMEHEHSAAGNALQIMREKTDEFTPPTDACNTYLAMLDGLKVLEHDMHHHVHKENNVLFPKSMELEQKLMNHGNQPCTT